MQAVAETSYVDVDLDRRTATVIFDPSAVELAELREAVRNAGYTPTGEVVVEG